MRWAGVQVGIAVAAGGGHGQVGGAARHGKDEVTPGAGGLAEGNTVAVVDGFGDGGSSSQTNPSHTYASAGTYNVSLTVTGPGGNDTETKNGYITVNDR